MLDTVLEATKQKHGLLAEIVLTGGPAGGKSASLGFLRAALASRGYRVLICPEMATMLYTGGIPDVGRLAVEERETYREIQKTMTLMQRAMRKEYRRLAEQFNEQVVIFYDRGELDCAAYLTPEEWKQSLAEASISEEEILASYDAVIHLRTAAGTPFGDLSNNPGRRESGADEAQEACDKTLAAWSAHPHLHVIEPNNSFEVKLSQLFAAVAETLARRG